MAKRIHAFGGRTHSTPFQRWPNADVYTTRVIKVIYGSLSSLATSTASQQSVAYWSSSGSLSGSPFFTFEPQLLSLSGDFIASGSISSNSIFLSDPIIYSQQAATKAYVDGMTASLTGSGTANNPITGSASSVLFFVSTNSASGDGSFLYDQSKRQMHAISASVSSLQIHRTDYAAVDIHSTVRNNGSKALIWDVPYYARGLYKEIMIQKEMNSTGTNFRYIGLEYSDVEHIRRVTTFNSGGYSFVVHYANYGSSIDEAGMRSVVSSKRYTYKQLTAPIRTASSTTNQRIYFGICDNPLAIVDYDAPSSYNAVAFRYISASANWTAFVSNGSSYYAVDTGITYSTSTNYLLRIELYGVLINFYIDGAHVATINATSVPSDTQDMYMMALIKNTSGSSSTKELGISHIHMVMS